MRTCLTLLLLTLLSTCVRAQIGQPVIDFTTGLPAGWVLEGSASLTPDGTAAAVDPNWNGRAPIASVSGGQALVMTNNESGGGVVLRSPVLDFEDEPDVWLSFHQYYRAFTGTTSLVVLNPMGIVEGEILLNDLIGPGVESPNNDTLSVNISALLGLQVDRRLEFRLQGEGYFWLLDDIQFTRTPLFPTTTPPGPGDYLQSNGYPYEVSNGGTAFVPDEVVVQFTTGTTPLQRQTIREDFGAELIESCACGDLELWLIDGSLFGNNGTTRDNFGGTTGILSGGIGSNRPNMVDGVDRNYYNITEPYLPLPNPVNDTLTTDSINGLQPRQAGALRIAILDTGIDYNHPILRDYVRIGPDGLSVRDDADNNGLVDDVIGWNFVDGNNNPYDNNDHGTHVAGIMAQFFEVAGNDCDYEFVPYKTHDANGVSTLFNVACATFQAAKDDVDFINDSWGFFGDSSEVLSNAIDTAAIHDILIISAAGNDTIDLAGQPQYPACYAAQNVVSVGALQRDGNNSNPGQPYTEPAFFTNFDPLCVDIMAPGRFINSSIPGGGFADKDGTSMAAPYVTAYFAAQRCFLQDSLGTEGFDLATLRAFGLGAVPTNSFYTDFSEMGRFLNGVMLPPYILPVSSFLSPEEGFTVYPLPFRRSLTITSLADNRRASVDLVDAAGRLVYRHSTGQWLQAGDKQTFQLPSLPSGFYLLRIQGDDYLWTTKLLRL